jgi:hypothetical protein
MEDAAKLERKVLAGLSIPVGEYCPPAEGRTARYTLTHVGTHLQD